MVNKSIVATLVTRNATLESLNNDILESLADEKDISQIEIRAKQLYESEEKRDEYLENKAQTFLVGLGLSIGIISAIPVLFDGHTFGISQEVILVVGFLYALTIIHFFASVYCSVNARRVQGFAVHNTDDLVLDIQEKKTRKIDTILQYIIMAKYNEPILTQKSNLLSAAETMFIRGLFFVAIASILVIATRLWTAPTISSVISNIIEWLKVVSNNSLQTLLNWI